MVGRLDNWLKQLRRNRDKRSRLRVAKRRQFSLQQCEARLMLSGIPPTAVVDSYTSNRDVLIVGASGVLSNDFDPENDPLSASLYTNASNGTVSLNANGGFTYTPNIGYVGLDTFQYRAFDGTNYSNPAIVTLTVTNPWSGQMNGEDRIYEPAWDVGKAATVGHTGEILVYADVGDGHSLVYSTATEPKPVIAVETDFNGSTPSSFETILTFNGVAGQTVYYNTIGLNGNTRLRFAKQVDATALPSGKYDWTMVLKAKYSDGSSNSRAYSGSTLVANWNANAEGDSWSIADKEQILTVPGGKMWVRGDGVPAYFSSSGTLYASPAGPYAYWSLVQNANGTFTLTDQYGVKAHFSSSGNLTSRVDTNNNSTIYVYIDGDSDGQSDDLSSVTDPWGRITNFNYSNNILVSVTDHVGRITSIGHDTQGRVTSVTRPDPDGAGPQAAPVWNYTYLGTSRRILTVSDPLNHSSTLACDFAGRLDQITESDGGLWKLDPYQTRGLIDPATESGTSSNPAPLYLPNLPQNLYGIYIDEVNQTGKYIFNSFGQPTTWVDQIGNTTTIQRNSNGRVIQVNLADPDGAGPMTGPIYQYQYDALGNQTRVTYPDNAFETWVYNTISRPTSHTDQLNRTEIAAYDSAGNMLTHTSKASKVTAYVYNSRGQVTRITLADPDDAGPLTSPVYDVTYDSLGRKTSLVNPGGSSRIYAYNTADMMTSETDELGRIYVFSYDNLDRPVTITAPDPDGAGSQTSPVTAFVYNAKSLLTSSTDPKGYVTSYSYDNVDRLTQTIEPDPDGAGPLAAPVWQATYNLAGLVTSTTDPVNATTGFTYTPRRQISTVTLADPDGAGSQTSSVTSFGYLCSCQLGAGCFLRGEAGRRGTIVPDVSVASTDCRPSVARCLRSPAGAVVGCGKPSLAHTSGSPRCLRPWMPEPRTVRGSMPGPRPPLRRWPVAATRSLASLVCVVRGKA